MRTYKLGTDMLYIAWILPSIGLVYALNDLDDQQQTTKVGSSLSSTSSDAASSAAVTEPTGATAMTAGPPSTELRAILWLLTQRDSREFGFRNDTALVLITLQLARSIGQLASVLPEPIDVALSGKQLEVETVVSLWRHSSLPPAPLRLAFTCLALSAICRDPRQFHGHDLIGTLLHNYHQDNGQQEHHGGGGVKEGGVPHLSDLEFGYVMLAACAARAHVRKRDVRRLLDVAGSPQRHNIDTLSVTIMTLRCIIVYDHRHRNWLHSIRKPSLSLARQQLADGSFGNVYNTALAMQALTAAHSTYWRVTAARHWLEVHQDPDGAFTDPGLTAMALMALMGRSMDAVRSLGESGVCGDGMGVTFSHSAGNGDAGDIAGDVDGISDHSGNGNTNSTYLTNSGGSMVDKDNSPEMGNGGNNQGNVQYYLPSSTSGKTPNQQNITVTYTLWIGLSNVSSEREVASVRITTAAAHNATFYTVMVLAAERDPVHFTFEASQWPNGHYVHTIAGHREEPMGYHYWLLYRLDERPDPDHPPGSHQVAPSGVDDLLVENGDHFLFWYKKL